MESSSMEEIRTFQPMRPWRIALVNGVIAVLVLGHLYDIKTKGTHWPFGQYEMFSHLDERLEYSRLTLMGVTPEGKELRISDPVYSAPMPSFHTRLAFINASAINDAAKRQKAMQKLCDDY